MPIMGTSDYRPACKYVTTYYLPPTQQPNKFRPYTETNASSIFHAEIKSISTTVTKPSQFVYSR